MLVKGATGRQRGHRLNEIQSDLKANVPQLITSIVPADGLAPFGVRSSAGSDDKFEVPYAEPTSEGARRRCT